MEMTLSSRHRIRNSNPGGLRPSTLPLGHGGSPQYWLSHVDGEETFFVSFKPPRPGTEPRTLAWKAAVLTTTLGPPVASQFVITFQFVINYYKLERICNAIASQFVINHYKLERICTAAASQFVINYYKLARICNAFAFQFVIKYYISDDTQRTLVTIG